MSNKRKRPRCCAYCRRPMEATGSAGKLAATRDHVIPKSKWNLADRIYGPRIVWCCRQCNAIKADMLPEAWEAFMSSNPEWWRLPQYQFGANVKARAHPPWALTDGTIMKIESEVERISSGGEGGSLQSPTHQSNNSPRSQ